MNAKLLYITLTVSLALLAHAADKPARPAPAESRITAELQDGSRVVGRLEDPELKFASELLGDFRLPVSKVRSIEWPVATKTATLKAVNGDALQVTLPARELRVKTSFGRVSLPTAALRRIAVTSWGGAVNLRAGLIALWSGEGNARDSVEAHDGELLGGVRFAPGKVGQAFLFSDTPGRQVRIPARADLDAGAGAGLTLSVWVNPTSLALQQIAEWNDGHGKTGVHLWLCVDRQTAGDGFGNLYANLVDTAGISHQISSAAGVVMANDFQHLALTYDKASGVAVLHRNGEVIHSENVGVFVPETRFPLFLGARPAGSFSESQNRLRGLLDEVVVYDRALSLAEIQALMNLGTAGEWLLPPGK